MSEQATHTEGQEGTHQEGQTDNTLPGTMEELQAMLQKETDKRVTQALATAKTKWDTEYGEKLENEKKEAARLAKLTAEQREKEVFEKQKADLAKQQAEFQRSQMLNSAMIEMQKESLPVQFAEYLLADTAEDVAANITSFKKDWQEALQNAVDERLKGSTPKNGVKAESASPGFFEAISKNKIRN